MARSAFSLRNLSVARIGTGKRDSTYYCLGACSQAERRTITLVAVSNGDSDVFDYANGSNDHKFTLLHRFLISLCSNDYDFALLRRFPC